MPCRNTVEGRQLSDTTQARERWLIPGNVLPAQTLTKATDTQEWEHESFTHAGPMAASHRAPVRCAKQSRSGAGGRGHCFAMPSFEDLPESFMESTMGKK